MSWSVQDLQNQIASEMDQSPTAPDAGGTDWNIRLNALNRSLFDWAETYDWSVLKKQFNGVISTSTGNASVVMPANFRKLDGAPVIAGEQFQLVDITRNSQYLENELIVNILGNNRDTNVLRVHGVTLSSGASVQFTYWASPISLASATNLTECPDPTFLVQRSLYYLYKGREDARFPEAKAESDRILARLVENENTLGLAHSDNRIHNSNETRGFRIGRD
jgi:hypothetical protein